jgi:hypothetical protein
MAGNFTSIDHPHQTEQISISQKFKAVDFCIKYNDESNIPG